MVVPGQPIFNRTLVTTIQLTETGAGSGRYVYQRNPFWPLDLDPPGADPALDSLVAAGLERAQDNGHNFYFTSEAAPLGRQREQQPRAHLLR
ncbi:hypothetical protein BE20_10710 [Sorangium cellulosum]|nr:hypothetical protein BE20_10710 [Sorangium cellulosum]